MSSIADRLARVRDGLARACTAVGREPEEVRLIAVSKSAEPSAIAEAADVGQIEFAENYLQVAVPKIEALVGRGLRWHMIGQVQSNKAARVATVFDVVHSLGSVKAARAIGRARQGAESCEVLIQVKLGGGDTRGGVDAEQVPDLAGAVSEIAGLRLCGLMAVAPLDAPARPAFARLRRVFEDLRAAPPAGAEIRELSAGMSADYADAVAEGATMVRIGSAIFKE